ncbi:MAG: hypothetical protein ACM31E_07365 [Fibrobacterota bacterium]
MFKFFQSLPLLLILTLITSGTNAAETSKTLSGQWCANDMGLILIFDTSDSMQVKSISDSTFQGKGTYTKTDTTFSATMKNDNIVIRMNFKYRWKNTTTIEALPVLFTVNDEPVESPKEWKIMTRCGEKRKS